MIELGALSDEELDALQLAVNTEIGARRQKARMAGRLAEVIGAAAAAGVPVGEIELSFTDAVAQASATRDARTSMKAARQR